MSTSTIHSVGELAFFHDLAVPGRSRDNSALRAFVAGQFLALDHAHKVAGRLDLEHLLFLEANAAALLCTFPARWARLPGAQSGR